MIELDDMQTRMADMFPGLMGVKLAEASPERVVGHLTVRDDLCTVGGILHGGAIMAFADTLGAIGTMVNLPEGAGTSTIESKTNFLAGVPVGSTAVGESTPLHRGGSTMVWQTRITREDGRLAAVVTQTQIVLRPKAEH